MGLELNLDMKQVQQLRMTPRLQQSINMLQLTMLELNQLLEQELVTNPTLELENPDEAPSPEKNEMEEDMSALSDDEENDHDKLDHHEDEVDINWDEFFDDSEKTERTRPSESEARDPVQYENFLTKLPTLREHLTMQLSLNTFNQRDYEIGEFLIGNIDRRGYLTITMEEAGKYLEASPEEVREVLEVIQTFDPPGIGATSIAECLLLQYEQMHPEDPDELVVRLLKEDLDDLSAKRYKQLIRKYGIEAKDIQAIHDLIKNELNPAPGLKYSSDEEDVYIIPDVIVEKKDDEYIIQVNDGGMPNLVINRFYRAAYRNRKFTSAETMNYIKKKLDAATWLIRSIEQRRETIRKVATSIVKFQRGFFDHGISHFRPLTLKKVAEDINMHESTVSRVTTKKYMQAPSGIYELKFFFSSCLSSDEGDSSSVSIKARIKELIEDEDPKKPLSDQAIVKLLDAEGVKIARRTVTKYREEMRIASSSRRKRY